MKLIQKATIEQVVHLLRVKNRIALFAHTNPDGDTIGASVALRLALQKMGKAVSLFCDGDLIDSFSHFPQTKNISKTLEGEFDLYVAVDCGDVNRLGSFAGVYYKFPRSITIDHHGGGYYSTYNYLADYASCCQMVYEIIKALEVRIDPEIATYLYMGLSTDTGNFAHSNTDADCFLMAADLCKRGASTRLVYESFYCNRSIAETKLYGLVLSRLRMYHQGTLALLYVTKNDLESLSLDATATSGLVRFAIDIKNVKVGVCIVEHAENVYKVSMRGRYFDVRTICEHFGGGGHLFASGCIINGMFEDVVEKIVRVVDFYL